MKYRIDTLYCKPLYLYSDPVTVKLDSIELEENAIGMSKASGVIEYEGTKLFLKAYTAPYRDKLMAKLSSMFEAQLLLVYNIVRRKVARMDSLSKSVLEAGIAPIVMVCRGFMKGNGAVEETLVLASPLVEDAMPLQLLAYDHFAGRGDGLDADLVRKLFCNFTKIASRIQALDLVHGDLNPSNILVKGDKVIVVDFDGMIPVRAYPPPFRFVPSGGDIPEFDNVDYDLSSNDNAMLLDWVGVVYTGTFLAHASKPVVEARARAGTPSIENSEVRKAFTDVLGDAFLNHLDMVLKGVKPPYQKPVVALWEELRDSGVC